MQILARFVNVLFDGDSAAIYRVSDEQSINEIHNNAYMKSLIKYEHNGNFIHTIINEADYAYNVLKNTEFDEASDPVIINNLSEITFDEKININKKYQFKDKCYTYGLLLINSWCEFEEVLINKNTSTQKVSELIYRHDFQNYHYKLNELNRKLNWFLTVSNTEALTIPFEDACKLLESSKDNELIHNLPKNPHVGFQIYEAVSDQFYNNIDKETQLYKLTKSKFRKTQFSKSLLNIGYLADANGNVISTPINGCVLGGLTEELFFETSSGTRKALVDKIKSVPASGYAQRT